MAKRNGAFAVRGGFLVWCGHAGGNTVNRVSGCMSVAGCGMRIPSSEDGPGAGFAAQENVSGEGIGWFAAKRDDVSDGRAPGMGAVMAGGLYPPAPLKGGDGGETDKCCGRFQPDI